MARQYYSVRTRKNPLASGFSLDEIKRFFLAAYKELERRQYFVGSFGYDCVDADWICGRLGEDIGIVMLRDLRKRDLWPIEDRYQDYTEDDLFDVIEWLYDQSSVPVEEGAFFHNYAGCGFHYEKFDWQAGKEPFLTEMNVVLRDYGSGYELTEEGEVVALPDPGLEPLLKAPLPGASPDAVEARVADARRKFQSREASWSDRRDAVRDLVDVLEYLRPRAKALMLKQDEKDLFNIANNFGIRHHRPDQKTGYDPNVWCNWLFYVHLATIHALQRLIRREDGPGDGAS